MESPCQIKKEPQCEVCNSEPYKYKCPACLFKTCSLACTTTHKSEHNCSGKRDTAKFIGPQQYSVTTFNEDYAFLEHTRKELGVISRLPIKTKKKRNNKI